MAKNEDFVCARVYINFFIVHRDTRLEPKMGFLGRKVMWCAIFMRQNPKRFGPEKAKSSIEKLGGDFPGNRDAERENNLVFF